MILSTGPGREKPGIEKPSYYYYYYYFFYYYYYYHYYYHYRTQDASATSAALRCSMVLLLSCITVKFLHK